MEICLVPSKSIPTALYEIWFDKKSSLGYLKTWRCPAYVKRQIADKLEDRSIITRFTGYLKESMEYYFYFSQDHNMNVSRNAIFLKKQFIQDSHSGRLMKLEEKISEEPRAIDSQEPIIHEPVVDVPLPCRRPRRIFRPLERYMDMLMEEVNEIFLMGDRDHTNDPNTFDEVMSDIDSEK